MWHKYPKCISWSSIMNLKVPFLTTKSVFFFPVQGDDNLSGVNGIFQINDI